LQAVTADINTQLARINVVSGDIAVNSNSHALTYDLNLSSEQALSFNTPTTFDGNGYSINLASGKEQVVQLADGVSVTTQNITWSNFSDAAIQTGVGASLNFGNGTVLELASGSSPAMRDAMTRSWICRGNVTVKGLGGTLDFASKTITVGSGCALTLENIVLDNVKTGAIICEDSTARVILRNVRLNLSDIFEFSTGALSIERDVIVSGQNSFIFSSDQPVTIASFSKLMFDINSVFLYAPTLGLRDLIVMVDKTSMLHLKGCYLASSTAGMRLTKGTLLIESNNNLDNTGATKLKEAISFGNGVAESDLNIEFLPGATLNVVGGILDYQNVNS